MNYRQAEKAVITKVMGGTSEDGQKIVVVIKEKRKEDETNLVISWDLECNKEINQYEV